MDYFNNRLFSTSCLNVGQVVAITVFFLLSVAYYAFFAPFLGKDIYEYVAFGVYSILVSAITSIYFSVVLKTSLLAFLVTILMLDFHFQALSVLILYARCTAIDPSDPGILHDSDKTSAYKSHNEIDLQGKFFCCCIVLLLDCMIIMKFIS